MYIHSAHHSNTCTKLLQQRNTCIVSFQVFSWTSQSTLLTACSTLGLSFWTYNIFIHTGSVLCIRNEWHSMCLASMALSVKEGLSFSHASCTYRSENPLKCSQSTEWGWLGRWWRFSKVHNLTLSLVANTQSSEEWGAGLSQCRCRFISKVCCIATWPKGHAKLLKVMKLSKISIIIPCW